MEEAVTQEQKQPSLFKERKFLLLWMAGLFSSLSTSIFMFSQSWFVVETLQLEASLGLIFIASTIPRLLFMTIGGVVADRVSKSLIMFLSDISRAILVVGLIIMLFFDVVSLWTFVGFALIFGVLDAFFWPASGAFLPSIVKKEQLTRANSVVQMTNQMAMIFGPMVAGFIIVLGGYSVVFGSTSLLLFAAALFIYFIKLKAKPQQAGTELPSFLNSIKEGLAYVKQSQFLTALLLTSVFLNFFIVGPLTMGLPLFVKNVLEGSTLDFSFLEGALGVGMVVGSVVVGILNIRKKRGLVAIGALLLLSISFMLLSTTTELWQSMLMVVLLGISFSIINIPLISVVQDVVEDHMIGRVMSLLQMSSLGLTPVSFGVTSIVLTMGVPINTIMLTGALCVILVAFVVYFRVPALKTTD
ncbi:MFS transporter [Alkalihalobacterium bogoriense]|uniref:MFS transporter n=1 Tax=Alkalihalobacterium bogoriense TaxID=246272 RepID=UPI00047B487D|nr:MFS transporter [Alkalihalobacterium bogoriense]